MRRFYFLSVLLMTLSGIFAQNFNVEGIQYYIVSPANTAEVSFGGNYYGDMVIPASVSYGGQTYSVTSIGEGAFQSSWQLTSVQVPVSVSKIRPKAFKNCIGLKSINIMGSIDSLGNNAFENCNNLMSFSLPVSINGTCLGNNVFVGCSKMTAASLPNTVNSIGTGIFAGCTSLQSFDIPNGWTKIPHSTFNGCTALLSAGIPDKVKTIETNAFAGCSSLKSISLSSSVDTIGWGAFYNCTSLTSVTIPSTVKFLWPDAFALCSNLNAVHVGWNIPLSITADCFRGLPYSSTLYVPDNTEKVYKLSSGWKNFFTVEGSSMIFNYEGIDYRTISSNEVEVFGYNELYNIVGNNIFIPSVVSHYDLLYKVMKAGEAAFKNWLQPVMLVLPDNIIALSDSAFYNCRNLISFQTPEANTSIGKEAFSNCVKLNTIYIPKATKTIGDFAFFACETTKKIWINIDNPANLTLGVNVFQGMKQDECDVYIPKGSFELYRNADQWKKFLHYVYQPAPGLQKAPAVDVEVSNLHEFDYDAYFLTHTKFDSASAFEFFLSGTPVQNESPVKVYPAITRENIRVSGITGNAGLEICDIRGSVVYRQNLDADTDISLASLPQAVYVVRVTTDRAKLVYRIVKN